VLTTTLTDIGEDYLGLGTPARAIAPLERAMRLHRAHPSQDSDVLADTEFALARATWGARRARGQARRLARSALDHYAQDKDRQDVSTWLASH
jgi:hypothetical protein